MQTKVSQMNNVMIYVLHIMQRHTAIELLKDNLCDSRNLVNK